MVEIEAGAAVEKCWEQQIPSDGSLQFWTSSWSVHISQSALLLGISHNFFERNTTPYSDGINCECTDIAHATASLAAWVY